MAQLLKTDGTQKEVSPTDGKAFTYPELKDLIGADTIDMPVMPSGKCMVVNDNGKLSKNPVKNELASYVWEKEYPIDQYPHNNDGTIVGDALVLSAEEYDAMDAEDTDEPDDFSGGSLGSDDR